MKMIHVFIIDDSAVVRQAFTNILNDAPGFNLLGTAANPLIAMRKMQKQWPDVIILDIEMPQMDGLTFLRKLMNERPTPVVMCSSLTQDGASVTVQVLSAGAVDIITKPESGLQDFLYESHRQLLDALRAASQANLKKLKHNRQLLNRPTPAQKVTELMPKPVSAVKPGGMSATKKQSRSIKIKAEPKLSADALLPALAPSLYPSSMSGRIIGIGASTGGTLALELVLRQLPVDMPGILVVQHMSESFTAAFAARLNSICALEIKEAAHMDDVKPGRVLIAPGGQHLLLKYAQGKYFVELKKGPLINRHRPSVDILFRSIAQTAGAMATGLIMTGMGDDGARGLKEMHNAGATTFAQDEASCVVFGMPKEAIKLGGVDKVVALEAVANYLMQERSGV
ncbi:protein-glutamate methylesterase/protein-glutamine glutaminase [Candidatus Venteria ishoeyi]|uniref:Protein-glutamate methylesterase/protein-glutamine glutaminase n=1 Tax=Candidatus Venteria ishoeyi TaxID=1899563 RepID=A0A1H6F9M4_9GAMM|nr:chemotaxis response regulator protein-glutamate methylesterase [Candidatus Venteria ishoeyi]MDM8545944.1 chemotaxis response regulator protein-glutamate methylesterase [Candidatus Venteria ishoeyi]SEH06081.1 Chemotaxis response regulator protein-glutamate methylesterase of group 3 operon [Candidatus Venteria ishoeyi]